MICGVDAASKIITIVAGTGAFGYSGDGALATAATMRAPDGVTVDSSGNNSTFAGWSGGRVHRNWNLRGNGYRSDGGYGDV